MSASFPTGESELRHIFRQAEGHVTDTPENRGLLLEVANDEKASLTPDQYGNEWSMKILPNGKQAWTQVRNGKIVNGGINAMPRNFNPHTGLKKL